LPRDETFRGDGPPVGSSAKGVSDIEEASYRIVAKNRKRRAIQNFGFFVGVLGVILLIVGRIGLNLSVNCPANGYSSADLWRTYGPYRISAFSGISLHTIRDRLFSRVWKVEIQI